MESSIQLLVAHERWNPPFNCLFLQKDGMGFRQMTENITPTIPSRAREDGSGQPCIKIKKILDTLKEEGMEPTEKGWESLERLEKIAIPVLTPNRENKRQNGRRFKEDGDESFTLTSQDIHGVSDGTNIRRLTPTECERLQSFPDGWTEKGIDEQGQEVIISDTQRYKTLGNAVTTNVIEYIIKKLNIQ